MEGRHGQLSARHGILAGVALTLLLLIAAGAARAEPVANNGIVEPETPLPSTPPLGEVLEGYFRSQGAFPEFRDRLDHLVRFGNVDPELLAQFVLRADLSEVPPARLLPVLDQLDRVADSGLPVRPVVSRYLQGLAKNVPLDRIEPVALAVEERLAEAASHLDQRYLQGADRQARLTAIDHAAYALGAGLSIADLDRSLGLLAAGQVTVEELRSPLMALSFLVSAGVESGMSFEVVQSAWDHGFRGADLERLGAAVGRLGNGGEPPQEIVSRVMTLLGTEIPPERVFENLDAIQPEDGALPPVSDPGNDPSRRRGAGDRPQTPPQGQEGRGGSPQLTGIGSGDTRR